MRWTSCSLDARAEEGIGLHACRNTLRGLLLMQVEYLEAKSIAQEVYARDLEHSVDELQRLLDNVRSKLPVDATVNICDVLLPSAPNLPPVLMPVKSPPISGRRCTEHLLLHSSTISRSSNVHDSRAPADDGGELTTIESSNGQQFLESVSRDRREDDGLGWNDSRWREVQTLLDNDNVCVDNYDMKNENNQQIRQRLDENDVDVDRKRVFEHARVHMSGERYSRPEHAATGIAISREMDLMAKDEPQNVDYVVYNHHRPPMLINLIDTSSDRSRTKVDYPNAFSFTGCSSSVQGDDDLPGDEDADGDSDNLMSFSTRFWTPIQSSHSSFAE